MQRSPLTGACQPMWFEVNLRLISPYEARYFNYFDPYPWDKTGCKIPRPRVTRADFVLGFAQGGGGGW